MPGQDKTGPTGRGSMTGRGAGSCGSGVNSNFGFGFGRGCGCGFRRGMGNGFNQRYQMITKEEKKDLLKSGSEELRAEAQRIEEELKELEK